MVTAFQERRDVVVALLNAVEGVRCLKPQGAFYVFPNVAGLLERLGAIEAYGALRRGSGSGRAPRRCSSSSSCSGHGVATMDRRSFGILESEGQHFLRVSVATGREDLERAVGLIDRAAAGRRWFRGPSSVRGTCGSAGLAVSDRGEVPNADDIAGAHDVQFGTRRGEWLDVGEVGGEGAGAAGSEDARARGSTSVYRTLCAILYNYAPTSGHPGGSISSGRFVASVLFGAMEYDLARPAGERTPT